MRRLVSGAIRGVGCTLVLLAGCGPSLRETVLPTGSYQVNEACASGPFELTTELTGNRWGETVLFQVRGAVRTLSLNYQAELNGERLGAPGWLHVFPPAAAPGRPAATWTPPVCGPAKSAAPSTVDGLPPIPEGEKTIAILRDTPEAERLPLAYTVDSVRSARVFDRRCLSLPCAEPKRGKLKITFWSVEPVDFSGLQFQLAHVRLDPEDEAAWVKKLEQEKAERDKKSAEDAEKARIAAATDKLAFEAAEKERIRRWEAEKPERLRKEKEAAIEAEKRKKALQDEANAACVTGRGVLVLKSGSQVTCWTDKMRADGAAFCKTSPGARYYFEGERLIKPGVYGTYYSCPGVAPVVAKAPTPIPTTPTTAPTSRPSYAPPDRPPPPPKPEARPAQPGATSRWTPGYWKWDDVSDYVWIPGSWSAI